MLSCIGIGTSVGVRHFIEKLEYDTPGIQKLININF